MFCGLVRGPAKASYVTQLVTAPADRFTICFPHVAGCGGSLVVFWVTPWGIAALPWWAFWLKFLKEFLCPLLQLAFKLSYDLLFKICLPISLLWVRTKFICPPSSCACYLRPIPSTFILPKQYGFSLEGIKGRVWVLVSMPPQGLCQKSLLQSKQELFFQLFICWGSICVMPQQHAIELPAFGTSSL